MIDDSVLWRTPSIMPYIKVPTRGAPAFSTKASSFLEYHGDYQLYAVSEEEGSVFYAEDSNKELAFVYSAIKHPSRTPHGFDVWLPMSKSREGFQELEQIIVWDYLATGKNCVGVNASGWKTMRNGTGHGIMVVSLEVDHILYKDSRFDSVAHLSYGLASWGERDLNTLSLLIRRDLL